MSMDYEKAYKEALERAKEELKTCGSMDCAAARQVFKLFPELAESEDEKIRARLIVLVEAFSQGKYKDEMLTYLEKQKEQKPAEWSEEDELMRTTILQTLDTIGDRGSVRMQQDWLKSLRPQTKPMGAYEELKQPVWRKIKKGDHLPCRAYLWKLGFEDKKNFHGDCFVDGYLVPNEAVGVGCDTWYLPVDAIKNLPKEE